MLSILFGVLTLGCATMVGTKSQDDDGSDTGTLIDDAPVEFGEVSISPASVDFGNVKIGEMGTAEILLTNQGDAAKMVTNAYTSGDDAFDVAEATVLPFTIDEQSIAVLVLTYAPEETGQSKGTLYVGVAEQPGYAEIDLSGTGKDGSSSNPGDDTGAPVTGEPALSFDTTTLDFGEVGVDATSTLPLTVTNTGSGSILITGLVITDAAFDVGTGFSVPAAIEAGASATIPVEFTPLSIEGYTAIRDFETDPEVDSPYLDLFGAGAEGSCEICAPVLSVSTEALSLAPPYTYGCTASGGVSLTNSGDRDLALAGVRVFNDTLSTCGTFSRSWAGPSTLAPSESTTIAVDYIATTGCMDEPRPDLEENILRITSDDPDRPEVFVTLAASALLCE